VAEVVDSIIVELIAKTDSYRRDMDAVIKKANETRQALAGIGADDATTERAVSGKIASRKKLTDAEKAAAAEEKRAAKEKADVIKQAAKEEAAAQKAAAKEAAAAVKAAEKEKQQAIAATQRAAEQAARRQAQLDANAAGRIIHDRPASAGSGTRLGATAEPGSRATVARQTEIMSTTSPAAISTASIATEREVNNALIQRIELQERLKVASGEEAELIRAQLTELNLATAYERAGLEAKEAALRLDRELVVIETQRAERAAELAATNKAAIELLELRAAKAAAASKTEAASIGDQIAAQRQVEAYKARGLTEAEAQAKVAAETLAIEERRVAIAAEQAALVERQMRAQQGAIANKISGAGVAAGAIVGGLGVAEVSHLNDEYIKLQNTLKVTGASTLDLEQIQTHLLTTANRAGTDIDALADVYRGVSLASHDLGASQADMLKVTDAAANALRIQGRSSTEAQGALLQLGHAFESGRVTAREFNSLALNLYPILQAVAKGSDQWGGSVAKLRQEIVTTGVSSKEFFEALLKGSGDLEERASKATLTTAQGFNALRNSLVVYFGEADKAQGVSAALGTALQSLANNLDVLIPAIAAIGTALTVGYITRMTAAAIATRTLGASILGAFGGPIGLAITAVGLAIAGTVTSVNDARLAAEQATAGLKELQDQYGESGKAATVAGSGIQGVGTDALGAIPHVNAFAGAVGNLAQQLYNQARAARAARVEQLQGQLQASQQKETDLEAKLPGGLNGTYRSGDALGNFGTLLRSGYGRLTNALSGGYQDQDNRTAYGAQVQQSLLLQRQIAQAKAAPITAADIPGAGTGSTLDPKSEKALASLNEKLDGLEKLVGGATGKRLDRIKSQIDNTKRKIADIQQGVAPSAANAAEGGGGAGRGPSADTIAKRQEAARKKAVNDDAQYNADLRRAQLDYLEQQVDLTNDGAKRAELERQRVRFAEQQYAKEIAAQGPASEGGTGKYTSDEVKRLQKLNTDTADLRVQGIDQAERIRQADDARSIGVASIELEKNRLQAQQGLADTLAKRRVIADQLLDLEYQEKEKALEAVLAYDSKATPAERQIALTQLQALPDQKALDKQGLDRQNEGVGASYLRSLGGDRQQIFENSEVKALQDFNSGLDQSVAKALHLHGIFGDILKDLIDMAIKQALIKPLAGALFGGGAQGGGGGIGGLFGSLLGAIGIGGGGGAGAGLSAFTSDSMTGLSTDLAGFLADGGPAEAGKTYMVGERGPELLRMGPTGGTVIPNHAITAVNPNMRVNGSGPPVVHQTVAVDARGAVMNDQFASMILSQAADHANVASAQAGQAAYGAAVRDASAAAPGAVRRYQQSRG
jgi:tape measure domain-containing protein